MGAGESVSTRPGGRERVREESEVESEMTIPLELLHAPHSAERVTLQLTPLYYTTRVTQPTPSVPRPLATLPSSPLVLITHLVPSPL